MYKYTQTCDMGHGPVEMEVMAENDEQALEMMLAKVKEHMNDAHSEMEGKSDDEMRDMIKSRWTRHDEMDSEEEADNEEESEDEAEDEAEEETTEGGSEEAM